MIDDPERLPLRYRQPGHREPVRVRWWEALASLTCVILCAYLIYAALFGRPW